MEETKIYKSRLFRAGLAYACRSLMFENGDSVEAAMAVYRQVLIGDAPLDNRYTQLVDRFAMFCSEARLFGEVYFEAREFWLGVKEEV
mgnify:CR=1 FL=1